MNIIELLKVLLIGIVEGITEWLPISSTGHMILVDEFIKLNVTDAFKEMFFVVIQLGAIFAVVVLYIKKLIPFSVENKKLILDKKSLILWLKIIISCIPAAVIGLLFEDELDAVFYNSYVVAFMLILYGILFIIIEKKNKKTTVNDIDSLSYRTAFSIGLFQVLSLIPGTSRSGATILGAILIGTSREVAAEFTFFLAIPVMAGASLLKIVKYVLEGFILSQFEIIILITGMLTAFIVSVLAIKFLVGYIKKNDFTVFGWYRIILGVIVLLYFVIF
ncbi:MAG: undecaprenyl-diphosphate phosphatase [Ruminococcaceae bacterium]|nr:undecaprenyl-diphosphate phosphatase [Oscillospiraceae bacterium]